MALEDSTAEFLSSRIDALTRENLSLKMSIKAIANSLESAGMKSFADDILIGSGLKKGEEVSDGGC